MQVVCYGYLGGHSAFYIYGVYSTGRKATVVIKVGQLQPPCPPRPLGCSGNSLLRLRKVWNLVAAKR